MLVSGGMDSCVAAVEAQAAGFDLFFFHGNYGQKTEARERSCFHAIADRLGVSPARRLMADMRYLGAIGGSSLTDRGRPVEVSPLAGGGDAQRGSRGSPRSASGDQAPTAPSSIDKRSATSGSGGWAELGAGHREIPTSYVPFRNSNFLTIAVSWAETLGAAAIYIGAVEADSSGYPDCREEYFRAFARVIELGTRPETQIRLVTPLIHLDKAGVVKRGLDLDAPFELTWSCYSESDLACGVCDSCTLRLRGFANAGAADPIPYAERGA